MIKTNFLGCQLTELLYHSTRKTWRAFYERPPEAGGAVLGVGKSPEEACAIAQKLIKEQNLITP